MSLTNFYKWYKDNQLILVVCTASILISIVVGLVPAQTTINKCNQHWLTEWKHAQNKGTINILYDYTNYTIEDYNNDEERNKTTFANYYKDN